MHVSVGTNVTFIRYILHYFMYLHAIQVEHVDSRSLLKDKDEQEPQVQFKSHPFFRFYLKKVFVVTMLHIYLLLSLTLFPYKCFY